MKKLNYGEIIETDHEKIKQDWSSYVQKFDPKRGDIFNDTLDKNFFSPVLVCNSDEFLDVEYRFSLDKKIYSLSECLDIQRKLK